MRQWREQFLDKIRNEDFNTMQRADRCHRRAFAKQEVDNPNTTFDDEDPRWDDLWTTTTSDD
jgi:hypothetical protein